MAKIKQRRLYWDASTSTDVVSYNVYAAPDTTDVVADADSGVLAPVANVTGLEWFITLPDGTYSFAVTAVDAIGYESDPYQHPAWVSVPLDMTPPAPPSGGGIDYGDG